VREVIAMWKNTRMVVLVALCAAIYAAVLIPFKIAIPLIPGLTEVRPANALPIVFSLLFGPAAAWGSAFGNLIGDFFGTLGLGSLFGFIGNFLYGYLPYRIWRRLSREAPSLSSSWQALQCAVVALLASGACALVIGWGVDLLGLVPFAALGNIILLNNFIVAVILSPFLMRILYPRVEKWGLLYKDVLEEKELSEGSAPRSGHLLLWLAVVGGMVLGNVISLGLYDAGFLAAGFAQGIKGGLGVGLGLLPCIVLVGLGAWLI